MAASRRILVVEDDPLVSEMIAFALEDQYVLTIAACAADAEFCLREGVFDVVLLDCVLPGGRADHVAREAERLGIPVVLASGDIEQIDRHNGKARPFLTKPFSIDRLTEVLDTVVAARKTSLPNAALSRTPGSMVKRWRETADAASRLTGLPDLSGLAKFALP